MESFGTSAVSIEVDMLNASMLGDVKRERDVVAVAPVMPLKLIEPEATAQPSSFSSGPAWGIEATRAAQSTYSGDGITVAVLDTGIDRQHKAFDDKGLIIIEENFTADPDGSDRHGHGTHCAATIFGRDVDGTRIGVARGVKRALIGKVLGTGGGQTDQIVRAIQWAVEQGAHVISMSLGMDFPGYQKELEKQMPPEAATSLALEGYRLNVQLFERLAATYRSLGQFRQTATVLVAAAGNESKRPAYEIAVSPPAVSDGFISVAALAQSASGFAVAPFSNTGAMVAAPGVSIVSAKRGGGLIAMSGTSMAAPHVAGVAALWAQKQQSIGPLTATLLGARLIASGDTDRIDKPFKSGDVGSGLVQAPLT
jgi:subtilisin family serine protease